MAALLKVTGEEYPVVPALGSFSILQLQELVNCFAITVIPARHLGKDIFIVADEEGFDNDKRLNPTASREASRAIYGDVLIAKYAELGGAEEVV